MHPRVGSNVDLSLTGRAQALAQGATERVHGQLVVA
jgi:hypothetical protein